MATEPKVVPESSGAHGRGPQPGSVLDDASSSDDGVHDKEPEVVVSRWQKIKRHFRRFWWAYLIALIILLAILLPILFKVIIPAIIKDIVRNQQMPVNGGALNFTAATHLNMTMDTSLDTPLGVTIDPAPLGLYIPPGSPDAASDDAHDSPFVSLQMPEQHVDHQTDVLIPEQVVQVLNMTQLTAWFNQYFDQETVELRIKSDQLNTHLGALDYTVALDKTIQVPGLNYLKGFGIQDMQFTIPPDSSGRNIKGHLIIPNHGVLTLGMGNVTFNVMAGDVNLGLVAVNNLDLKPGNNTPAFDGVLYFDQLVPHLATILSAEQGALADGMLELNATGNTTINYGEHIPYIEGVLNLKSIPMRIPVTSLLLDIVSGVLAGGSNGTQPPLLNTLGEVLGNRTLFEQMLDYFEPGTSGTAQGSGNGTSGTQSSKVKRGQPPSIGRTMKMNLFRLGLRTLRSGLS